MHFFALYCSMRRVNVPLNQHDDDDDDDDNDAFLSLQRPFKRTHDLHPQPTEVTQFPLTGHR